MSFMKRALEAAETAADQARQRASEVVAAADRTANDPEVHVQVADGLSQAGRAAREAAGRARKGIASVTERIDPGALADLIIRATALQEQTNASLRRKGSPYRISEVSISASIPPGVAFAIARLDDPDEPVTGAEIPSTELAGLLESDPALQLDGTLPVADPGSAA